MEDADILFTELEKGLREFPLRHMERHVLPEFRVTLEQLVRRLQQARLPVKTATLAPMLRERARMLRIEGNELRALIKTVALKAAVLGERKEWHAYAASGRREEEPLADTIELAARRTQHALRHCRRRGADVEVHRTQLEGWLLLGVSRRGASELSLAVAWRPTERHVLLTRSSVPVETAVAIANGLGWSTMEKANLSGKHMESLLRVLEQDRNCSIQGLVSSQPYVQRAVFRRDGMDTDDLEHNIEYAKMTRGGRPPRLTRLEGRSRRPFIDGEQSRPLDVAVRIDGEDVAETLVDMVRVGAIHPNSEWLHLFRSTTSNIIDLDALDE